MDVVVAAAAAAAAEFAAKLEDGEVRMAKSVGIPHPRVVVVVVVVPRLSQKKVVMRLF